MKTFSFPLRAVQLDLARQMETADFIRDFIDFIAANGYNALVLYLEGRIRTASFPYPDLKDSYTVDEMREIAAYAAGQGVEIIPVVSVLGHAELFLDHLPHLGETRPPYTGRFGPGLSRTFCPSTSETVDFLKSYLKEVHEIFGARYFHVGCDEVWDMGRCDLCRRRLAKGETESGLFVSHLLEIHRFVTGELGARMIIWDDMFECYRDALEKIPRDVVLACWQYQQDVSLPRAHFMNRLAEDALAEYDRMGFQYLVCPSDYTLCNTESFTAYAAGHRPLGGLLTTWEKSHTSLLQSFPLIGAVGRFWAAGGHMEASEALRDFADDFFGVRDETFFHALHALFNDGLYLERQTSLESYLTKREGASIRLMEARRGLCDLLLSILPSWLEKVRKESRNTLAEVVLSLRSERASSQLSRLLPSFFHAGNREQKEAALQDICREIEEIACERMTLWQQVRAGISSSGVEALYESYLANLRAAPSFAQQHGALTVHFMLPDQYSAQTVAISIRYAGSDEYHEVGRGVFKELRSFDCFFSRVFPVEREQVPVSVKVETWGFGGVGFTFFEVLNDLGRFVPCAVLRTGGIVADPDNLLQHDWQWTFAGQRNVAKAFQDGAVASAVHGFEIELASSSNVSVDNH